MAEKENNQKHKSTIDKYSKEPQMVSMHGQRKTRKKETTCLLQ